METSIKQRVKCSVSRALKACLLFVFFIISGIERLSAQDLKNLKHNLTTIKDEQKNIAHQEFMSYVYMVLGFSVVIFIAWFSTVKARKRSKAEAEIKAKLMQQNLAHRKAHGTLHKARR